MNDKVISLGVQISLGDKLSGPGARALNTLLGATKRITAEMNRVQNQGVTAQIAQFRKLSSAREILGVRSEKIIQREIKQTELAYKRLKDAGVMSLREQERAAEATKRKISALRAEMGIMERERVSAAQRARSAGHGARNVAIGTLAAGAVVKPALDRTLGYERNLALTANTAFKDRNLAGRRAGMTELDSAIVNALRIGGGSRDAALDSTQALVAANIEVADAIKALPAILKSATATGSDPLELSRIAVAGMKNFGFGVNDIPKMLNMAAISGQEGSFELRDQARWLPSQMALAANLGMRGDRGMAALGAANQAAMTTAGSADEAGNNVSNLLRKLNSGDTRKDFKDKGIDLTGRLTRDASKGIHALDSFAGLVEDVVSRSARWKKLQKELDGASSESDRRAVLDSMKKILEGSVIQEVVQDAQALGGLLGYMNERRNGGNAKVERAMLSGVDVTGRNMDLISGTNSFKVEQLGNEKAIAEQRAMGGFAGVIGDVATKLTHYAQEYPGLTTALSGLTTAATAAAAALFTVGAMNVIGGRGGAAAGSAAGTAAALAKGGGRWSRLLNGLGIFGAAAGGAAMLEDQPSDGSAAGNFADSYKSNPLVPHQQLLSRLVAKLGTSMGLTQEGRSGGANGARAAVDVTIKVDQQGRVTAATARSGNASVPVDVNTGLTMQPGT